MKLGEKIKGILLGLAGGLLFALGIIIGVKIDKNIVVKGKLKQKTGKGGVSNIHDITSVFNIKKQTRQEKKEARKEQKLNKQFKKEKS